MQTKRLLYLILALLLTTMPAISQGLYGTGSAKGAGWLSGQLPENSRFNLELGTGFSSFSSGASMFGNYIAPRFEYDLNPSLTIIAGGNFSFNQYNNAQQSLVVNSNASPVQQGLTDYSMFMSGRYMINDNLFMTGTVYSEQGHIPPLFMNQGIMDYSNRGMSMGLEYKISENFRFGAEFGVNRTNNPYQFYSPFSNPFNSRYGRSGHRSSPF